MGFTKINVPNYGTALVNGASQTGSSLVVDGLTAAPQAQDQFTIAGVEKIYTVWPPTTVFLVTHIIWRRYCIKHLQSIDNALYLRAEVE